MIPPFAAQSFDNLDHVLRIEELYLLQRVAQKISSILDLQTLLDQIVADVGTTFSYDHLAVLLKDDQTGQHVLAAGRDSAEPMQSKLEIPLQTRGESIGVFKIEHSEMNAFSPERVRLLEALAGHLATAIANARMFQRERLENARMAKELEEARTIQSGLFPPCAPETRGFDVTGVCLPCREVGGDWYDYIPLGDDRIGVVLADVSGKGLGAALLMASSRSALRLHAARGLSPQEILFELNKFLVEDFPSSKFVTLVYVALDPGKGTVTFASAGHLPPLLVDSTGARYLEAAAGLPLGIMECQFSEHEVEMSPGSRLFLYSDGVTEAINAALEEYGPARILQHVTKRAGSVQSLLDDVAEFTAGHPPADDVTVVTIAAE